VTTQPEAQAFFDQGLRLYWAFNHDEAYRSFAKAALLDPRCTMCLWGAALTLGPNYNMPMMSDRTKPAWDALQGARALAPTALPVERALVGALTSRYAAPGAVDEKAAERQNRAYAAAMREVAKQFPDDADVQVLSAEASMVLNPWKLWTPDGKPAPGTAEILATLEGVLAKQPGHPGANHLYVHAVEASPTPGRGVPAADRIATMMPNAGHLVHMPSHIYQRVGRYEDSAAANRRAIEADRRYAAAIAPRRPPGVYEMYMGHNHQFLAFADAMQGKSGEGIEAAQQGGRISPELASAMPPVELFAALPAVMMLRFGRWSDVLASAPPDPHYVTATGLWRHARGMALAATGHPAEAQTELEALSAVVAAVPPEHPAMMNKATDVLAIAVITLEGKIAEKRGDTKTAVARLEDAVRREDALSYDEPPNWWYPVRHVLGATLLSNGRPHDAELVYRADLRANPENGWSLSGLARSLELQGKKAEASAISGRARVAWKNADIPLAGSWPDAPAAATGFATTR
jgi:tetratricopeptide (TPR) repeat protein